MGERTPTTPRTGAVSTATALPSQTGGARTPADSGTPVVVRQAEMDRDEILRIVESLPRNDTGKLPRQALCELLTERATKAR